MTLTRDTLRAAIPGLDHATADRAMAWLPSAMEAAEITTPPRAAAFLALLDPSMFTNGVAMLVYRRWGLLKLNGVADTRDFDDVLNRMEYERTEYRLSRYANARAAVGDLCP